MTTYPVSYTSVSDIDSVFPAISSASGISSADVAYFAGRVEVSMNAKLARSYSLPFTQEIKQLSSIATDLAIYDILAKRIFPQYPLEDSQWPDRYKEATESLDRISEGTEPLLDNAYSAIATKDNSAMEVWSNNMSYVPTFNEDSFEESVVNADKLDDIADDR